MTNNYLKIDWVYLNGYLISRNPLTARVFVNRIWQMHFGKGLTSSSDDLGNQGRLPSHPQLLDWLSNYFMDNDWDIKKLHKKILSSATFQQESKIREDLVNIDPENFLWQEGLPIECRLRWFVIMPLRSVDFWFPK